MTNIAILFNKRRQEQRNTIKIQKAQKTYKKQSKLIHLSWPPTEIFRSIERRSIVIEGSGDRCSIRSRIGTIDEDGVPNIFLKITRGFSDSFVKEIVIIFSGFLWKRGKL